MNHTVRALVLCLALASVAHATNSSEIAAETSRTVQEGGNRVANFWWLPLEYWQVAAVEMGLAPEERAKVDKFFPNYIIVGVIDADVTNKQKPTILGIAEIVSRTKFTRDGERVEVLREVAPEVAALVPKLVYLLKASMGKLGEGLRLLPLANIDTKGNPVLTASKPGVLGAEFRFSAGAPVHDLVWHAPLTSVAGSKRCPKDGEAMDASWTHCPWHGNKLETPPLKPKP